MIQGFEQMQSRKSGSLRKAVHGCRLSVKLMLRDIGVRVSDAKINKVCYFLSLTLRLRMEF